MIVSSTLVSILSVLLVAIDRFLYILYGLQYQRYIFPNRARILIVTTWILGELLAVFGLFCYCHLLYVEREDENRLQVHYEMRNSIKSKTIRALGN